MEIKFVDTVLKLIINGAEFSVDVGEIEQAEIAAALITLAFEDGPRGEVIPRIREKLDVLLGAGAAETIFSGQSPTNDLAHRKIAAEVGKAITGKRAEILLEAFKGGIKEEESAGSPSVGH